MEFDEINNFISKNLPSIDACKIKIEKKNDTSLIVTAPLEYNKNDKGIKFYKKNTICFNGLLVNDVYRM